MIKYNNNDISNIYYGTTQITKVIYGNNVVWELSSGSTYGDYVLAGKFTNDVGSSNIIKIRNDGSSTYYNVEIPYDPDTKEFAVELPNNFNSLYIGYNAVAASKFIEIYHLPKSEVGYNSMSSMFKDCKSLTSLDVSNLDTSKVTDMSYMFYECSSLTSLDVSNFDTSNVTNMSSMFYNCPSLTSLDLSNFDTSNVTNMGIMFYNCTSLTSLDLSSFDTSKVRYMNMMFYECSSLTTLNLDNWNLGKISTISNFVTSCTSLTTITGTIRNIEKSISFNESPLTNDSAMVFINGLSNVSTTQTIKFSASTYRTLTPEQKAIATSKGWTVASA